MENRDFHVTIVQWKILCRDFVSWSVSIAVSNELVSGLVLIHCQRLNRPKALRTFTYSAPLVRFEAEASTKSRFQILGLRRSLGISLERYRKKVSVSVSKIFDLKKVSVLVSKHLVGIEKSLSIGLRWNFWSCRLRWPWSLQFIVQIRPECSLFAPKCCLLAPGFLPEIVIIAAAQFPGKSPF